MPSDHTGHNHPDTVMPDDFLLGSANKDPMPADHEMPSDLSHQMPSDHTTEQKDYMPEKRKAHKYPHGSVPEDPDEAEELALEGLENDYQIKVHNTGSAGAVVVCMAAVSLLV